MTMAAPAKVRTREAVLALQDAAPPGVRYELIDGEVLVSPSPSSSHQLVLGEVNFQLSLYCRTHRVGRVLTSPADLALDGTSILQPDVFVVPPDIPLARAGWESVTRLLLAVEVLSPSTARGDRTVKRRFVQRQGVPEYWIVDLHARLVERWRPEDERPEIVTGALGWQPRPDVPPLAIDLPALFADALAGLQGEAADAG